MRELHSRVFSNTEHVTVERADDLFRAFMICAIGSVMPYRNGKHSQHPEGYYLAALGHLDSRFLARGLRSVEDLLLLICRFGIYHNIGKIRVNIQAIDEANGVFGFRHFHLGFDPN